MATCINDTGWIGGVCWTAAVGSQQQLGFVWLNGTATTFASPDGGDIDTVVAVNSTGQAVCTYLADSGYKRAFFWDGAQSTDLGDLGDPDNSFIWPVSLSDAGQVVGTLYTEDSPVIPPPTTAFVWLPGGAMSVVNANSQFLTSTAIGQNGAGTIIGSFVAPPQKGSRQFVLGGYSFLAGANAATDLGSLGGGDTLPFSVNEFDGVTGTTYAGDNTLHLFDWQPGGALTDLGHAWTGSDDLSFQLTSVNQNGDAAGFVTDAQDNVHAFVRAGGSNTLFTLDAVTNGFLDITPDNSDGQQVLINNAGLTACPGTDREQNLPEVLLLTPDADGNGLPDGWEKYYFGYYPVDAAATLAWNSSLTILQAYQLGLNPTDPYQGQAPVLVAASGTPQTGPPAGFAPQPLVAQVSNVDGTAILNAVVSFSTDVGQLQASSSATPASTLVVPTDANGLARVFFLLPGTPNTTCTVTATVTNGTTSQVGQATFNLSTDDGSGSYASPFDLVTQSVFNADASSTLSWTQYLDGVTGFTVSRSNNGGASWTQLASLPATSTGYTVSAGQQGVIGYSVFKVQPLVGATGATSGTNGAGTPPAPSLNINMPPPRYVVVDLGLTADVGWPKQINNNGTVLLAASSGAISRWRQGNLEQLYTFDDGLPVGYVSYPWSIDGEDTYPATLDDQDNVAINTGIVDDQFDALRVFPPNGAYFALKTDPDQYLMDRNNSPYVYCGEGGTFYGFSLYRIQDSPSSDYTGVYDDGARWTGQNTPPVEYGSLGYVPDPNSNTGGYVPLGTTIFPVSVHHGVELLSETSYQIASPNGWYLGGLEMPNCSPQWQNSSGAVLASLEDGTLADLNVVSGTVSEVADEPFPATDVSGFNAAQITLTNADGSTQQQDAPQLVGVDSMDGQTPFVYEENPISRTDVEVAVNALLDDAEDVSGGESPAVHEMEPSASNVDTGNSWSITSVTGINDSGMIIAVSTPTSGDDGGTTTSGDADAGGSHSLLGSPVQFTVTTTASGTWDGSNLVGYKTTARASINAVAAAAAGITGGGIWRDVQSVDRLSFTDGTMLFCGCPWLADTGSYQVAGTPDGQGNLVWSNGDLPLVPTVAGEVAVLSNLTETFNSRWFLVLTINGQQKVVMQCETSYTNVAMKDYSGPVPKFNWIRPPSISTPLVGASVTGNAPNPATPPAQRPPRSKELYTAAGAYVQTNANWHANGGDAAKYQSAYGY